jgi:enoyl-CoA hydratase
MAIQETIAEDDRILVEKRDGVGRLTFNNPARHNAMSRGMWEQGGAALADFARDPGVRAVLLTGAGNRAFVAGADISRFESERASVAAIEAYDHAVAGFSHTQYELRKPVIARIDGYCIGGGLGIAVGCDIRVCTARSTFAVPAAKLGIGYRHAGIRKLEAIVGPAFTAEIFYTGRQFTAEEARIMGLVNRVLPDTAALDEHLADLLGRITENAPLSIATVKQTLIEFGRDEAERDMSRADDLVRQCFTSNDYVEGRTAFMEKRKPKFTGT